MAEYDSDIDKDTKPVAPKPKKIVTQNIDPEEEIKPEKKITTKLMIIDALTELNTRKGVSLYAIKTHLNEKFQVNTEKLNFRIKKTLRACVEDGTFVQLKGIGASGSFKLAAKKVTKPKKIKETEKGGKEKSVKTMKQPSEKKSVTKSEKKAITKSKEKVEESEVESKATKKIKEKPNKQISVEEKKNKPMKHIATMEGIEKKTKVKMGTKENQTPAKKRAAMIKRRSIGSIIKPPKMKPKNK